MAGMWNQDAFQTALNFAGRAHQGQKVPGGELPYVVHICQVAAEVMASPDAGDLGVLCAVLHDTLEDTSTTYHELAEQFGLEVAAGVKALTKDETLPKGDQMADSLARIKALSKQVQMVKLADRITNLQKPPHYWRRDKCVAYRLEAEMILRELGDADQTLAQRLKQKIEHYGRFIDER